MTPATSNGDDGRFFSLTPAARRCRPKANTSSSGRDAASPPGVGRELRHPKGGRGEGRGGDTQHRPLVRVLFPSMDSWCTDLTRLLPVGAVGDVEEDFEDLYDPLRGFQRDGWCFWVQHTLILVLPLDPQTALQSCCENGHTSLLEEEKTTERGVRREGGDPPPPVEVKGAVGEVGPVGAAC